MAAITVNAPGTGFTLAAANAGGDTVAAGTNSGGHRLGVVLLVSVGVTATTVSIDGVAQPALTSQSALYFVDGGTYKGRAVPITYSQATSVTVGAMGV